MMNKNKVETYIFYILAIFVVVLFIFTPAFPNGNFQYALDDFLNNYLFGDGFYRPKSYPFSAKVTNSFSVVAAIVLGIFMGFLRRNDVVSTPKAAWLVCILFFTLGFFMFLESIHPQEYIERKGRSFGTDEAFHNNPVLFVSFMAIKAGGIYLGLRLPIALILHAVFNKK